MYLFRANPSSACRCCYVPVPLLPDHGQELKERTADLRESYHFINFSVLYKTVSHFSFFLDNKVELTYRLSRGVRYRVHLSSAWYRFGQRLLCKEAALLEQPSATSTSSKQVNGSPRRSASDEVDYYITYQHTDSGDPCCLSSPHGFHSDWTYFLLEEWLHFLYKHILIRSIKKWQHILFALTCQPLHATPPQSIEQEG